MWHSQALEECRDLAMRGIEICWLAYLAGATVRTDASCPCIGPDCSWLSALYAAAGEAAADRPLCSLAAQVALDGPEATRGAPTTAHIVEAKCRSAAGWARLAGSESFVTLRAG